MMFQGELAYSWRLTDPEPAQVAWLRGCFRDGAVFSFTDGRVEGVPVRVVGTVETANSIERKFTATIAGFQA